MKRTHHNGELRLAHVGEPVTLVGWVSRRRNLGALVFIDLRDRSGIVQITVDEKLAEQVKDVRNEYILQVEGKVVERQDKNPKMATGDIEVYAETITIVNTAETTPMIIADETDALEDTRLKYRYLDLRRAPIQNNLMLRHKVTMLTRNYLSDQGFIEVETPILCKSTPEGARDYLVPSRIFKGKFFALPQSPQIYKQLLMVGGIEKYFQIARCFRDEDLRADRQPEFTQIDIEMSFVDEEQVWTIVEGLMKEIFRNLKQTELPAFPRLTYNECMARYGTDKPDTRFGMEIQNVSGLFQNTEFTVFKNVLEQPKGMVGAIVAAQAADQFSRKEIDKLQEFVKIYGAKALAWLKMANGELSGSVAKVLKPEEKTALIETLELKDNDLIFLIADKAKVAQTALGALRIKLGRQLKLIDESQFNFLWVTNFPMFEYSEEEQRYVAAHHPFTSPNLEDVDKLMSDPENCYSRAYDLVLNGYELLSGSIRIHDQHVQEKVFEAIGMSMEEAREKFGFFIDAFRYGTPPHGGVGIGLERLVMILAGTDNIRDVVAFPKTASASDLMSEAPNTVDEKQLKELHIALEK
ncbi:aspartate--tRNA ligase [Holdemania massiliensis]|uniref:Aspartate--tRNA ligase n=1 Tax=Holdemania massiliensis TaxID=1468449 RepID=A0A6N7S2G8_9FIRM|nr:aspartate--tRNA ligase [Holdemania massiliensis]MSA70386.1 aspartate--tRNA ligase [Holdemania massiliensis]MSA88083.1 aspartate--tRNA ligase [Holdemania massiliensis]MSB76912.1 aspartate--tRNA ligase [Holdemania massiliensis]MSC31838.1 aspartate--tRNA ligase [Holdemania massiliensis]MSC38158.1 aspartate--tRNA ligase [Holdemania massiliensis]